MRGVPLLSSWVHPSSTSCMTKVIPTPKSTLRLTPGRSAQYTRSIEQAQQQHCSHHRYGWLPDATRSPSPHKPTQRQPTTVDQCCSRTSQSQPSPDQATNNQPSITRQDAATHPSPTILVLTAYNRYRALAKVAAVTYIGCLSWWQDSKSSNRNKPSKRIDVIWDGTWCSEPCCC